MYRTFLVFLSLAFIGLTIAAFPAEGDQGYVYLGNERYLSTTEDTNGYEQINIVSDEATSSVVAVGDLHSKAENGESYQYKFVTKGVNTGETFGFVMVTPADVTVDWMLSVDANKEFDVCVYQGISGTVSSTEITTIYYKNLNATDTRTLKFYERGTAITGLVCIDPGTAGYEKKSGGTHDTNGEWILQKGMTYLIDITAQENTANFTVWSLAYEEQ